MQMAAAGPANQLIKGYLPDRRVDPIGSAHHFSDPLKTIVNHVSKILGKQPIAAVNNKVFGGQARIDLHYTAQAVAEAAEWCIHL